MNTRTKGATFAVADVRPAKFPLPEVPIHERLGQFLGPLESCCDYFSPVVASRPANALLQSAYLAFCEHRPLILSPDIIWLTIAQGLAEHVNLHSEPLRRKFVKHTGRLRLVVDRPDFVLGSPENPWEEVFDSFSDQIRLHLGGSVHEMMVPQFSTTGKVERAAYEVVLMGAMRSYFDYVCLCICGIPAVTLEGTSDDWRQLRKRAGELVDLGLAWWADHLLPVLDQFVRASEGDVDLPFWRDLYQSHPPDSETYGGPYLTFSGWIGYLFPYTNGVQRNPLLYGSAPTLAEKGVFLDAFPPGISRAPVLCKGRNGVHSMEFLAGLVAVDQHPETLALRPRVGWAVRRTERD